MADDLIGASVWEQDLYHHLTSHEAAEDQLLTDYKQAAEESSSPAFRFVASLILEDEKRHHRLFEELAATLKSEAELRPEPPPVPDVAHWGPNPERVIELTESLLKREREDEKDLGHLAKELKDVKDTTLWQLLVRLMEMDTAKHITMLDFVKKHAGKRLG